MLQWRYCIPVGTAYSIDLHLLSVTGPMTLQRYIVESCEPRAICSLFAALSGHTDRGLYSHHTMVSNIRHQVYKFHIIFAYILFRLIILWILYQSTKDDY